MPEDKRSQLTGRPLSTGVGLAEVLPFLVGLERTGRLAAAQDETPALEVWIERGRVVDAAWGRLRALSALEMGAVFLPQASFVFSDGLQSQTRRFDLAPMDLAARLAEVAREGAALAGSVPGPQAVPAKVEPPRQRLPRDPEALRLLNEIDGQRSVAELVEGRQPLVVLRGLAGLAEQGAIDFLPAAPPAPAPLPAAAPPTATPTPAATPPPPIGAPPPAATPPPSTGAPPPAAVPPSGAPPRAVAAPRTGEGEPPGGRRPVGVPPAVAAGEAAAAAEVGAGAAAGSQAPDAAQPPHSRFSALRGRQASLLIIAATLVVLAFAIVDSLQTLTPEAPPPAAAVRPAAPTAAQAPTVAPTAAQAPTVARTAAPQAAAAPTVAPQAAVVATTAPEAAVAPTVAPQAAVVATTAPQAAVVATAVAPTAAPQATVAATAAPAATPPPLAASTTTGPAPLLDETFTSGAPGWPNSATSSAWSDSLGYHLEPRLAGQHVAITAPGTTPPADIEVAGLFHKGGGPGGGGYGLILRAQRPLDGTTQAGRYYVFEVGDRGEVGAWRRDEDRWVDLLSWTQSSAVFPGGASNRLDVRATGSQFTFSVNAIQVAQVTDDALASGAVGVFTGGDGNQVVLERFTVTGL